MDYKQEIKDYLEKSGGIITSSYCRVNKIPTIYLSRLVKEGLLFRVTRGIYITTRANYDEFYFFQYNYKKAIFSYETALFLLGATDKIPHNIDVTVYNSYKFNKKPNNISVHYVDEYIYEIGIEEVQTMYGNLVKIYSYERTLCDFIANKENMDIEVYVKIIRFYSSYKNKDINKLYKIAAKMNIINEVRNVMETVL